MAPSPSANQQYTSNPLPTNRHPFITNQPPRLQNAQLFHLRRHRRRPPRRLIHLHKHTHEPLNICLRIQQMVPNPLLQQDSLPLLKISPQQRPTLRQRRIQQAMHMQRRHRHHPPHPPLPARAPAPAPAPTPAAWPETSHSAAPRTARRPATLLLPLPLLVLVLAPATTPPQGAPLARSP